MPDSGGTHQQRPRLVLDRSRKPGRYARRQAEQARQRWFASKVPGGGGDELGLWEEFRRLEAGALAEETVGRFLDLLRDWGKEYDLEVYHSVELQGAGTPGGDIDHLVVARSLPFAVAIETKYRLHWEEIPSHRRLIAERQRS